MLLADEINRAPAKTHSALLEIMQENRVTIDGVSYPIEPPFLVMATQNPIESEGTYNLPEAQLDRFLFKLVVEYPSAAEETDILRLHTRGFGLDRGVADQLDVVTSPAEVREMQTAGRERSGRRPRAGLHREPGAEDSPVADVFPLGTVVPLRGRFGLC